MADRTIFTFGIEIKEDIDTIIGYSDLIPKDQLHIQKGTHYARRLSCIDTEVSVALVAKSDRINGCQNYTIGYIGNANVLINHIQARPIMVNHGMVQRAITDFTHNDAYLTYDIEIFSPKMNLIEFLNSRGNLSPNAAPDRLYKDV